LFSPCMPACIYVVAGEVVMPLSVCMLTADWQQLRITQLHYTNIMIFRWTSRRNHRCKIARCAGMRDVRVTSVGGHTRRSLQHKVGCCAPRTRTYATLVSHCRDCRKVSEGRLSMQCQKCTAAAAARAGATLLALQWHEPYSAEFSHASAQWSRMLPRLRWQISRRSLQAAGKQPNHHSPCP
jgi:hypothetical protein